MDGRCRRPANVNPKLRRPVGRHVDARLPLPTGASWSPAGARRSPHAPRLLTLFDWMFVVEDFLPVFANTKTCGGPISPVRQLKPSLAGSGRFVNCNRLRPGGRSSGGRVAEDFPSSVDFDGEIKHLLGAPPQNPFCLVGFTYREDAASGLGSTRFDVFPLPKINH